MRLSLAVGLIALTYLTPQVGAQVTANKAPPPPPPPPPAAPALTMKQLGVLVYPAKGQTPEQQAKDEEACYHWAEAQTGLQLNAGAPNTAAAGAAAKAKTDSATQGAAVVGAAKGAVAGVAIGAIAGDAGTGAAIGAAAGAMAGRRAKKQAGKQAEAQGAQQAQSQQQAMVDQFKKAASVCLEGRGYTAK